MRRALCVPPGLEPQLSVNRDEAPNAKLGCTFESIEHVTISSSITFSESHRMEVLLGPF